MAPSKKTRALLLLGIVLFAAVAAPARAADDEDEDFDDEEDAAFLVIRKALADESPAFVGKPATVTIEIFNAGESPARNIKVDDGADLPDGISLAPGAVTTASFKSLDVGATAKLSYDVVAALGGRAFELPRAAVAYTVADGGKDAARSAKSSAPVVYVETPAEAALRHVLTVGTYGTLGIMRTPEQWRTLALVAALGGALFGGSAVWGKAKEAGAAQRRSKALAALEKEK